MAVGSTGILKYFRPVGLLSSSTTQTLPDLDGLLSDRGPAKAIKLAYAEVWNSLKNCHIDEDHRIWYSLHCNIMKWVDKHRNMV